MTFRREQGETCPAPHPHPRGLPAGWFPTASLVIVLPRGVVPLRAACRDGVRWVRAGSVDSMALREALYGLKGRKKEWRG